MALQWGLEASWRHQGSCPRAQEVVPHHTPPQLAVVPWELGKLEASWGFRSTHREPHCSWDAKSFPWLAWCGRTVRQTPGR